MFHNRFKKAIMLLGYVPAVVDPCLFVRASDSSFVALWVDDFVTAMKSSADMAALVRGLSPELTINKWGPLKELLGMTFTVDYNRDFRSVFAAQGALARLVVQRAGLEDANPARSPGEPGFVWSRDDCPKTDEERAELEAQGYYKAHYVSTVAATNYITCITRLDNKYTQSKLASMG